jgi:hypothetical protein
VPLLKTGQLSAKTNNENTIDLFMKWIDLYNNNPENQQYSQEYENAIKMINKN